MKKLVLFLIFSSLVFGSNTTIKALFSDVAKKAKAKNYSAISKNVYSLNSGFNVKWIVDGIKHPNAIESTDNGFTMQALEKIIKNSDKFVSISKCKMHKALKSGFIKSFKDDNANGNFFKDLKKDKNVYVLGVPSSKSSIVVYKDGNDYKLIWWKEMVRVANSLK
jgi:hypothetical protein